MKYCKKCGAPQAADGRSSCLHDAPLVDESELKPPPKHTAHGNYDRADWFEAKCKRLETELAALQRYPCKANRAADPPQDCDAPFCGCNPAWTQAIEWLQECGWLSERESVEIIAERDRMKKRLSKIGGITDVRLIWRVAAGLEDDPHGK